MLVYEIDPGLLFRSRDFMDHGVVLEISLEGVIGMLSFKEFLRSEVVPAHGCTEPGAVALAVARAYHELKLQCDSLCPTDICSVLVKVSDSIYKNGMSVGIPGAGGARGNAIAAALGVLCGNAERGLEVLHACTVEHAATAEQWVREGRVKVIRQPDEAGVYVKAIVETKSHQAVCVIKHEHANIVAVTYDGEAVFDNAYANHGKGRGKPLFEVLEGMDYQEVLNLADEMDDEDEEYLLYGAKVCRNMAEYATRQSLPVLGLGARDSLGNFLAERGISDDPFYKIRAYCQAASSARMAGTPLPVMSSSGSGNHGITAILPVALLGEYMGKSNEEIARALAISHLSTGFIKSRLGRLSPVCGCVVAAGPGASAGMVSLMGGDIERAVSAMTIVIAGTVGMICDGAKETCSLRVGVGVQEAYLAALVAMQGGALSKFQGIVGSSLEETVENVGALSKRGMVHVDPVLIEILDGYDGYAEI